MSSISAARSAGYQLEGIEGYLYPTCGANPCAANPGCNPPGTTPLHRRYHPELDDYALFPESERAAFEAQGYNVVPTGQAACLGYVYPNQSGDGDGLIDGFEALVGTDPEEPDSDCDGASDGTEVLSFPYGDPRSAPGCLLFKDGFESSTVGAWSTSVTTAGSSLVVSEKQPLVGSDSLRPVLDGNAASQAFVRDHTPASEARYRARFYLNAENLSMTDGNSHYILIANGSIGVLRIGLRTLAGVRAVKLFASHNDGSAAGSAWFPISGTTALEVDWKAASGPGLSNGYAKLWLGGNLVATLPNLDNDTLRVDHVSLGAVNGVDAGTAGYLVVDAFESRKATYIGLVP